MPTPLGLTGQNWLGKADIAVQTVLLAVGLVAVGLRLWSRRLMRSHVQGNDWYIVAAAAVAAGRYVIELMLVLCCGMGLHNADVLSAGRSNTFVDLRQLTFAGDLLWIVTAALIQLSILHYFLQIFQRPGVKMVAYILIGLSWSLGIASSLAHVFLCSPVDKMWQPAEDGKCGNRQTLNLASTGAEVGLEASILLLSLPVLWKVEFSPGRKLAVGSAHLLGLIITAATAITIKLELDVKQEDLSYTSARKSFISCVILPLALVAACIPTLAPVAVSVFGTTLLSPAREPSVRSAIFGARGNYKTTVSGQQAEEIEVPLVTLTQPPIAKRLAEIELAHGSIFITSDWEIHSSRNSTRNSMRNSRRIERSSLRSK